MTRRQACSQIAEQEIAEVRGRYNGYGYCEQAQRDMLAAEMRARRYLVGHHLPKAMEDRVKAVMGGEKRAKNEGNGTPGSGL